MRTQVDPQQAEFFPCQPSQQIPVDGAAQKTLGDDQTEPRSGTFDSLPGTIM